jgi:hypothetical protein
MNLSDLIDKLVKIHNSKKDYNPEVSIMTEIKIPEDPYHRVYSEYQIQHNVTDITENSEGYVVIIGQELE